MTGAPKRKGPHPAVFFLLTLPYGTGFGYIGTALLIIASQYKGVDQAKINPIVAFAFAIHAWKFFWAPVVDTTFGRKRWYLIGLALMVAGTIYLTAVPVDDSHLGALTWAVIPSQIGMSLLGMANEGLLALAVPEEEKGRCSGWYQAGIFFGLGVGGWISIKLSLALPQGWMVGAVLGGFMLVSALGLLLLPQIPRAAEHARNLGRAMVDLLKDLWRIATSRSGLTGLVICLSPVGAGALSAVINGFANEFGLTNDYQMNVLGWTMSKADILGVAGSVVGGMFQVAGAIVGGFLADRMNRRLAYALGGSLTAVTALVIAFIPHTPGVFVFGFFVYAFFNGITQAAFVGFVIETIGKGAAATKYNIFASLANQAISYMTKADSAGGARWGIAGACLTDAALTFAGIAVLVALVLLTRPRRAAPA